MKLSSLAVCSRKELTPSCHIGPYTGKGEVCSRVTCEILTFISPLSKENLLTHKHSPNLSCVRFGKIAESWAVCVCQLFSALFYGPRDAHAPEWMKEMLLVKCIIGGDEMLQEIPLVFVLHSIIWHQRAETVICQGYATRDSETKSLRHCFPISHLNGTGRSRQTRSRVDMDVTQVFNRTETAAKRRMS